MSYVLGQTETRSKIKDSISNTTAEIDKMLDPNNKDGKTIYGTKYPSSLSSITVSDVICVQNTKLKVERCLQELSDVKTTIKSSSSNLSKENINVKPWKANDLIYHDKQIEVIEEKVKEILRKKITMI